MTRSYCFITVFSLGVFYSANAKAGCEKDTDCKGDRICQSDACVDPPAKSPAAAGVNTNDDTQSSGENKSEEGSAEDNANGPTDDTNIDGANAETAPSSAEDNATKNTAETPPKPTDPKDWWKQSVRTKEAPVLQEIFNEMPRPMRKKGNAKLLYHRAIPLVVSDIHTTTTFWGGKGQMNVRFLGISKVHSTTTMDPISETTPGIAYCPINCDRITSIAMDGENISIMYDGDIKDWGGKASDVHAGYTRKVGKHNRSICSFPVLYNLAPANAWLDPEAVKAVQTAAVNEINRYCGK